MEWIGTVWEYLVSNWYFVITTIITAATVIVKITPNTTDNKYLEIFVKIFEALCAGATPPINSEDAKSKKLKKAA